MINNILNLIVSNFGFKNYNDFLNSMIHFNLLKITIPIALISTMIENAFGLNFITIIAFILLLLVELTTGILASNKRGIKIESKKFGRFGFKLFVWLSIFFIVNALKNQYLDNRPIYELYEWMHDGLVIYVSIEYLISILENFSYITGVKNKGLVYSIKKKVGMASDEYSDFFDDNYDLLCILGKDLYLKKINENWKNILGWSKKELFTNSILNYIHPDDIELTINEFNKLDNKDIKTLTFINRMRTKNDTYIEFLWNVKLSLNKDILGILKVIE